MNGWESWQRTMNNQNFFVPTLQTIVDQVSMGRPWMPVQQGDAADAAGQSPRGRPPVAWESSLVARPSRDSRSVTGRANQ
eukprot:3008410-Pyramimonas_sp.AAC.1